MLTTIILFALFAITGASASSLFTIAGEPGWMALIPGLNAIISARIARRPIWLALLSWVPVVGIVASVLLYGSFAAAFRQSRWWGVGIAVAPFIFLPALHFRVDRALPQAVG